VDVAAPVAAEELVGKIVESSVVGCVVIQVFLDVDANDWANALKVGNWIWFGIGQAGWIDGALREGLRWM
jgi:hypothetical protein